MESENTEKKNRVRRNDYIAMGPEVLEHVDSGIAQVEGAKKGVVLSRKNFIKYRILKSSKKLSPEEVDELVELFYDEERYLEEALKEVRAAKARGEKVAFGFEPRKSPRTRRPKAKEQEPAAPLEPPPHDSTEMTET